MLYFSQRFMLESAPTISAPGSEEEVMLKMKNWVEIILHFFKENIPYPPFPPPIIPFLPHIISYSLILARPIRKSAREKSVPKKRGESWRVD